MKDYIQTDQQLHWLCQTIAKANRTFVPAKADDSHTNLYFDSLGNRIVGRWIEIPAGSMMFVINLSNLRFEWLNSNYQTVSSFNTIGKKLEVAEREIAENLVDIGLNPDGFTDALHYEIPDYSFTDLDIQPLSEESVEEWIYFRSLANKVCSILLGYLQIESEIRIWPHHFDTGIYAVTKEGAGIGCGLAMSDTLIGGPYFYMSGYPASGSLDYTNLPVFLKGRWETGEGWKGAVLPLSDIKKLPLDEYKDVINDYLLKAANWFIERN